MIRVDIEDQWLLKAFSWSVQKTEPAYAFRQIKVDGKKYRLGSFRTAEEAAEAYRLASIEHHGDFARVA